ncbi:MAG: hypothetical protein GF417_12020 [Candidatus Latescibacteria bacterium]|nr:hypothetical protein [bacterium]MBD3425153.1 hypothetical protein [Candidatus Latescibacterota bacterium]
MRIVGIHDGHNSAVSLLIDGEIVSAVQEERLVSTKNFFGFPIEAFKKTLEINSLKNDDIDFIAYHGHHIPYPLDRMEKMENYRESYSTKAAIKHLLRSTFIYDMYKKQREKDRIEKVVNLGIPEEKIKFVEHHSAHASAAYYGCPWVDRNEKVLVLTQDGAGDGLSGTVNIGYKGKIERIASIAEEDSLGRIYATTTFMMGMVPLEHEYKLMGMAPYAPDNGREMSYQVFTDLLEFPEEDSIIWKRKSKHPPMQRIYPYLRENTEFHRFDWIAAGLQQYTEEMLVRWVRNCIKKTGIGDVVLSGGTFMNVKANQRIYEMPEVDKLFIFPSCGDESNCIGAVYSLYNELEQDKPSRPIETLYLGPDETDDINTKKEIEKFGEETEVEFTSEYVDNIEKRIAKLLADGEVVARCKGPMEFGARALGNRSILSDPSDLDKIRVVNNMIKKRDFWMPFAPVMLKERSDEYIENPKKMEAPYMIITFNSTDKYKEFIGGVQQKDLTARPQIITEKQNKNYYDILKEFEEMTGKGVLINTSFNLHGLPIVYGPKEALYVFENSGLNYLALGNYLLEKKEKTV